MLSSEKNKSVNFRFQEDSGRLDLFLHSKLPGFSREKIKKLIRQGFVSVNSKKVIKPAYKLKHKDSILMAININEVEKQLQPQNIPISVIYEDEDIAVVNKPAGLLTHPVSLSKMTPALVNGLLYRFNQLSDINGILKPGIVHRLDKDTSGVLVVAKNNSSHINIAEQFKNRQVLKKYLAVTEGEISEDEGIIERPIARGKHQRTKMKIDDDRGKNARTYFKVLHRLHSHTFVILYPRTGRTHQLRVHMKYYGHPIIGDSKYGKKSAFISRQALHAYYIEFRHPGRETPLCFTAPLPEDFNDLLTKLGIEKGFNTEV